MLSIGARSMLRRSSFVAPRSHAIRVEASDLAFRVSQKWFDSIIYFYTDIAGAETGEQSGGTGFLLGWPLPNSTNVTLWAVTNKHIIEQSHWTMRVNTKDGGFACIDTDDREWICCGHSDLAVRPLMLSLDVHQFTFLTSDWLFTKDWFEALDIGPGDECITIGRFVGHGGRKSNLPAARFGQISQSPHEPVIVGGKPQECFLVESRSIGGTSGSPVYIHLDSRNYRPNVGLKPSPDGSILGKGHFPTEPWLLGICFAMIRAWQPVCDSSHREMQNGWQVETNTGMMGVVPAWHLHEFMDTGAASEARKSLELSIMNEQERLDNVSPVKPTGQS